MFLIWIGKYQSDMEYTKEYFKGSITYYGTNEGGNICCCTENARIYKKYLFISFIAENVKKSLGNFQYVFYNQGYAYEVITLVPECKEYIININSQKLIEWLSNKTLVRLWVNNFIKVPSFCAISGYECTYKYLTALFPQNNKFIIQDNYLSGGQGSYIIDANTDKLFEKINPIEIYLASPLIENSYSVNLHILVSKNEQIIFPPSIQIIDPNSDTFIFRGSDFIAAKEMPFHIIEHINNISRKISEKLAYIGYRGICGMDFIIQNENIYFIEINPRFQGSSFIINRSLMERNLPSLYELNRKAFNDDSLLYEKETLEKIEVNYSFFKLKCDVLISSSYIINALKSSDINAIFMDGLDVEQPFYRGYICRFISKRNIVSVNPNKNINIYENLLFNKAFDIPPKTTDDWTNLKTSLILQGLKISDSALIALEKQGGFQEGTFDAIDICFSDKLIVNCPLKIPFISFTPYTLNFINNRFILYFYDSYIAAVIIDKKDKVPNLTTASGLPYSKIIQRNNNRIRIRHNSVCIFKEHGKGCLFCHAKNEASYFLGLEDIRETFLFYLNNVNFDQIMIGGASNDRTNESSTIKEIIRFIRDYTNKKIYIMTIPPSNFDEIIEYKRLGANEIAFNIEIFNKDIAKKIMPEKGMICREDYLSALKTAVNVFGKSGEVRSMLIIGLEPLESFTEAIEALCKIGVYPMITPFRPMHQTKLENFVPPTLLDCQRYMKSAVEICIKYNITLGPSDPYSQNNTLNFVIK